MNTVTAAIVLFSITLICLIEIYYTITSRGHHSRHHNVFYLLAVPGILSLIYGLKVVGVF